MLLLASISAITFVSLDVSVGPLRISMSFLWNSSGFDMSNDDGLDALVSGSGRGSEKERY